MDKRGQLGYGGPGAVAHPIGYVPVSCKLPEDRAVFFDITQHSFWQSWPSECIY